MLFSRAVVFVQGFCGKSCLETALNICRRLSPSVARQSPAWPSCTDTTSSRRRRLAPTGQRRIADALPLASDAIPEFAGIRRCAGWLIVESDNRRPVRILGARGYHGTFDEKVRIDKDLRNSIIERLDGFDKARRGQRMRIVDLVPEFKRESRKQHNRRRIKAVQ